MSTEEIGMFAAVCGALGFWLGAMWHELQSEPDGDDE